MNKNLMHTLTVGGNWGLAAENLRDARSTLRKLEQTALNRDAKAFRRQLVDLMHTLAFATAAALGAKGAK
jgi:hypothetical protein